MNKLTYYQMKHILLISGLLFASLFSFAQNIGDYQTQWSWSTIDNISGWQVYDGSSWTSASQTLASLSPFAGDIYANHTFVIDADFVLTGDIITQAGANLIVDEGFSFTLGSESSFNLRNLTVDKTAHFINYGSITSADLQSKITLENGDFLDGGGRLENHGSIDLTGSLDLNTCAWLISGKNATIIGTGSIKANAGGARFFIANPGGYDEAIQLSGDHLVERACYIFNGDEDQVTGENLPLPAFSVVIDNGHKVSMSNTITLYAWADDERGDPFFQVVSGSTLDTGDFIIYSEVNNPIAVVSFILDSGATIFTSNIDGISSDTNGANRIQYGAVQTNFASYSSAANYGYDYQPGGSEQQKFGCFDTTPLPHTINDLYILTPNGLEYCSTPPTITGDTITLPVTLSYFSAFFNGFDSVSLQWETQSETNNLGFYILRSKEALAEEAMTISELIYAANSSLGATYSFVDNAFTEDGIYYYWLADISFSGEMQFHGPKMATVNLLLDTSQAPNIPQKSSFIRNYPNPFNPSTQLEYYLETGSKVSFKFYNLKGQLVDEVFLPLQSGGYHSYIWQPKLSSGTYLIKFSADGKSNSRKVILSK